MKFWNALIKTAGGRLERVQFESPSYWREDAIAQAKGAYGASEVVSCNPVPIEVPHVNPSLAAVKQTANVVASAGVSLLDYAIGWLVIVPVGMIFVWQPWLLGVVIVGGVVWFSVALAKTYK